MTRQELQTRILTALNDSPTQPVYWTAAEVQGWLTEGLEVLCEQALLIRRTFVIPRRPGVSVYQLPGIGANILAPTRVWLPATRRRLQAVTLAELDMIYSLWMLSPGESLYWAPLSLDQFVIWPAPGEASGWMEVSCVCWPEPLQDDDDMPELRSNQCEALVTYGQAMGALKQNMPQQLLLAMQTFAQQGGDVRAQASLNQVQERSFQRVSREGRG